MTADHCEAGVFDAGAVQRILVHLNRCHRWENLRLARLGSPDVKAGLVQAWLSGLDRHGIDLLAESTAGPIVVRLDFEWPASSLGGAGEEMRRLYRAASRLAS